MLPNTMALPRSPSATRPPPFDLMASWPPLPGVLLSDSYMRATTAASSPVRQDAKPNVTLAAPAVTTGGIGAVDEPPPPPPPPPGTLVELAPSPSPPPGEDEVGVGPPHAEVGLAETQSQTVETASLTARAPSMPQAPRTQSRADCWMTAEEAQRQALSVAPQPTAPAAEAMQDTPHSGTAEIWAAHGFAQLGAEVTMDWVDAESVLLGGVEIVAGEEAEGMLGDAEGLVVTSTTVVVPAGEEEVGAPGQAEVGLAETQEQTTLTASATLSAWSMPQAPSTQPTAVCWMAADDAHRQE